MNPYFFTKIVHIIFYQHSYVLRFYLDMLMYSAAIRPTKTILLFPVTRLTHVKKTLTQQKKKKKKTGFLDSYVMSSMDKTCIVKMFSKGLEISYLFYIRTFCF